MLYRLVDKSGVVFDTVDEEIRTHSRLTLDPTQEDPRFQEWRYRLLGKRDGVNGKALVPKIAEGRFLLVTLLLGPFSKGTLEVISGLRKQGKSSERKGADPHEEDGVGFLFPGCKVLK